jgi:predicted phosphodiesterase
VIVHCATLDDLVARVIEVATQLDKPIPRVSGRDMRDPGGVTDRNVWDLGGLKLAKASAMLAVGEAVKHATPERAAKKAVKRRPPKQKLQRGKATSIKGWRTVAMVGDLHAPKHHQGFLSAFVAWLADVKPDVLVLAGDILELESMSSYMGGGLEYLEDDVWVGNWLLDRFEEASPGMETFYLEGNHETRLQRWLSSHAPQLIGVTDIPSKLRLEERGVRWVEEGHQPLDVGGLRVIHGHQDMRGWGTIHAAKKMAEKHGVPGRTVVSFHTHKHQVFDRPHSFGVIRAIGIACGRTLKPAWKAGETDGWSHQWGLAYVNDTSARVEVITYADGIALHGGRAYR